jgi:hypothetical protein
MKDALAKTLGRELRPLAGSPAQATALPAAERDALQHFGMPFAGLLTNLIERR